jgi:uncharacterized membrane protein YhaH (DUF805 family)
MHGLDIKKWFSFAGRAGRIEFIVMVLVIPIMMNALTSVVELISQTIGMVMAIVSLLIASWLSFSACIRRLHDMGRSSLWSMIIVVQLIPISILVYQVMKNGDKASISGFLIFSLIILSLMTLVLYIACALIPGEENDNDYGPPPPRFLSWQN